MNQSVGLAATIGILLNLIWLQSYPAFGQSLEAPPVHADCLKPNKTFDRIFYVDPHASSGDGSELRPFSSVTTALASARGGDLIYLRSGDYGELNISGVNSAYITLAAAPGNRPILSGLKIGGDRIASHWRFSGLVISGYGPNVMWPGGWPARIAKINVAGGDGIIIDHNIIRTTEGQYAWVKEVQGNLPDHPLASGIVANNASCITIYKNQIYNVFNGIGVGGDQLGNNGKYIIVKANKIDNFAGDGIDHYGSHVLIGDNVITNAHGICNNICVHMDGIQGWTSSNKPDIKNRDVIIEKNVIEAQNTPNLSVPADALQGITIFDGNWSDVKIRNNVIVTMTWNGIAMYGVENVEIVNNTVVNTNPSAPTWIMVNQKKGEQGPVSRTAVIRNNIAALYVVGKITLKDQNQNVILKPVSIDHNVALTNAKRTFLAFDPARSLFDLHLSETSPARNAGVMDLAPGDDIEGRSRIGRIDAGAYAAGRP